MANIDGHEYIEIGGVKWATMNIGANSVTDYGQYFQWGDTTGYLSGQCGSSGTTYAKPFTWTDYTFSGGRSTPGTTGMTKYNASDGKTVLDICNDAARLNWGGSWRMPTKDEYVALGEAVNTAWTANYQGSGVSGLVCTDKTDSSKVLFFPACGSCNDGSVRAVGSWGDYWSSSVDSSYFRYGHLFIFNNVSADWLRQGDRCGGHSVRGVVG